MRSLALAVLALLALAAPASAGGTLLPAGDGNLRGGPLFAGERLAWATPDAVPDGYRIHTASIDGSGHSTRSIEAPVRRSGTTDWFAFDASAGRIAASLHLVHCDPACGYRDSDRADFPYSEVLSASGDGPFQPFGTPCTRAEFPYASVAVDGDVAAYATCDGAVVRDFTAGEGQANDFTYPNARVLRLAGPFLGSYDRDLVVREWRTGVERLRIPDFLGSFDLGPDGTVVVVDSSNRVKVATPAAPEPRVLAENAGGGVRLAGDRVAYTLVGGGVAVRRLDGSPVAESRTAELSDFDGARITWLDRTCARTAIATWDLEGAVPALPRAQPCPFPSLRSSVLRASGPPAGRVTVRLKLACVAEPAVGCGGQAELFAADARRKTRGRRVDLALAGYRLAPGERRTIELTLGRDRLCSVGRNGLRPVLELAGPHGLAGIEPRVKRRRVRVVGLENAIRRCGT
ncbi:MAG TPA: hypothetical protein VF715_17210 [Thermoleophilaceae bacterium]